MPARSPDHIAFGSAIRRTREEQGISQGELAERTGLDRSYVSGIERGERNPSLTNILKLAWALGVRASEIHVRAEGSGAGPRRGQGSSRG